MNLNRPKGWSLKTRVTLFTLAIFLTSIWSLSFYASYMLRADMQRLLGDQQSSTVSFVAAEINREINDRMSALKTVAGRITPEIMNNPQALQAFLNERPILNNLFNGGVVILNNEGTVEAEIAVIVGRIGTNYMDVKAVAKALKDGSPSIGTPVVGKKLQAPIFPIIVAIKDSQGAPIGALAGVINLSTPNFLDQLTNTAYGKNGYYLLEDPETRLIITGTGKARMMQPLPPAGINGLIDRHVQGSDETGVTTNPLGVEVLASAKRIPVANWFVVAALPTEEAFAPIRLMQQRVQLATFFLTLLAGILTWWMLRRQLSPMLEAINTLAVLSTTDQHPQPLAIAKQDEIGDLIAGFNRLLASLGQRDEALKASEQRFRDFFEKNSSVMLLIEPSDGRIVEANDAAAVYYG
jgi:PAS domain-containing protein